MITIEDIHFDMEYKVESEIHYCNFIINYPELKKSDKLSVKLKKYQLSKDSSV